MLQSHRDLSIANIRMAVFLMWYVGTDRGIMEFELAKTRIVFQDVTQRIATMPMHCIPDSIDGLLMWADWSMDRYWQFLVVGQQPYQSYAIASVPNLAHSHAFYLILGGRLHVSPDSIIRWSIGIPVKCYMVENIYE